MSEPVLVTGASGYIGGLLIEALLARGVPVRAMSRRPEGLAALAARGVEVVVGDVLDRQSLRRALDGVRAAYYLVHSMDMPGSEIAFMEYDRFGARNFALEGRHLDQIIYLGGLGNPGDDLSPHLRSRLEVGEILLQGQAPTTVLRSGIIIGAGSSSFQMLRYLVERLPVMVCPSWVGTRCQPIGVADVLAYLVGSLGSREATGRSLDIGGPEILTYRGMMDRTAKLMGKHLTIVTVPVLTPRLSAYWVDLITPLPASLAHALIEGLKNEVIVRDDTVRRIMPIPLTPFDDAVRSALRGDRRLAGFDGHRDPA